MHPRSWTSTRLGLCLLLVVTLSASCRGQQSDDVGRQLSWLRHLRALRSGVKDCVQLTQQSTWTCLQSTTLRMFDELMAEREIPLWSGVRLVRVAEGPRTSRADDEGVESGSGPDSLERKDLQHLTWFDRLAMRLAETLRTHIVEVNLKAATDAYVASLERQSRRQELKASADPVGTARHRRHRYNMIITMMFGVTALGAVLVPMGFQMLSVVSGKALLLAKMALLLASINGLKRVANSGIHYGLYHVPGEHYGGYYDRGDVHRPRQVPGLALAHPVETGIGGATFA